MAKVKKSKRKSQDTEYQPTEQEKSALINQLNRRAASPEAPRIKVVKDEHGPAIDIDHPDRAIAYRLLMEALGTSNSDFLSGLLSQLANCGSRDGKIDESGLNFMLSVIKDIKPRDQLEAMLAAQMAGIHMTILTFMRQLAFVDNIPQQDSAGALLIKLNRTFAAQMETLKRYRTGGEQKVTVQHVTVSEGGQAIVGNVSQAPHKPPPGEGDTSQPMLTDARATPMPPVEERKQSAPMSRRRAN